MPSIFISYRRSDSLEATGRIYDRLVQRFGGDSVFRDIDSIPIGLPFPAVLRNTLERTDVVLAVIGPAWASTESSSGSRRIDDQDDFVRMEIELAIANGVPLIPVTVSNASLPARLELPEAIRDVVLHNGVAVRPDPDFHHDMDRLISRLEGTLGEKAPPVRQVDREVTRLQLENELLRLDQEWLANPFVKNDGQKLTPGRLGCFTVGFIVVGTWVSIIWAMFHPAMGLIPALGCVVAIVSAWWKATTFWRAEETYGNRRQKLVGKIEALGE